MRVTSLMFVLDLFGSDECGPLNIPLLGALVEPRNGKDVNRCIGLDL